MTRVAHAIGVRGAQTLTLVLCVNLFAFSDGTAMDYPLQSEQVREAYFLGRTTNSERLSEFFNPYVHHFPYPDHGPYVESVEFRTPFERVVLRSQANIDGSVASAEEAYAGHPRLVFVRVLIFATRTFAGPNVQSPDSKGIKLWTVDDFLQGFQFRVGQERSIEPKKTNRGPACPFGGCEPFDGFEAMLQFDAEQFTSGTVWVEVTSPGGQVARAEFDLDELK